MTVSTPSTVLVLRRDPDSLSSHEMSLLRQAFPNRELRLLRSDPTNYRDHAAECEARRPAAVLLPMERPIPSLALERGHLHLFFSESTLMQLKGLQLDAVPFSGST